LESFFRKEDEHQMVEGFKKNTARYIDIFSQVAEELMPKRQKAVNPDDVPIMILRNTDTSLKTYSSSRGGIILKCMRLTCLTKMKRFLSPPTKATMSLSSTAPTARPNPKPFPT